MPQLDVSTFPSQIFWLFVTFAVLYVLMATIIAPRLERVIGARQGKLDSDLERATKLQAEAEAVMAAYEKALAEARMQAQATLKASLDRIHAVASERQAQASAEIAKRLAEAERRIQAEKQQALAALPQIASEVAHNAVARLVGKDAAAGAVTAAVQSVIKERA